MRARIQNAGSACPALRQRAIHQVCQNIREPVSLFSNTNHLVPFAFAETGAANVRKANYKGIDFHALFFSSMIIGSQSSTLLPSGSMIHANFPFSSDCGPDTVSTPFCFS